MGGRRVWLQYLEGPLEKKSLCCHVASLVSSFYKVTFIDLCITSHTLSAFTYQLYVYIYTEKESERESDSVRARETLLNSTISIIDVPDLIESELLLWWNKSES